MQLKNNKVVKEHLFMWKDANNIILTEGDLKGYMPNEYVVKMQTHIKISV